MARSKTSPTGGDRGRRSAYREQYGVIVICRDGPHQKEVYEDLRRRYPETPVKVVVT